jgi:hypothetical protein
MSLPPPRPIQKTYKEFLQSKVGLDGQFGFEPLFMPDFLFDFQKSLVEWAVRKGRGAIFADCGLGKSPMELVVAQNVVEKTNKPFLILTPLAVARQEQREGNKFQIDCEVSRDGKFTKKIVITNYERLHHFNPDDFIGCAADESSILKNFDGKTKEQVTEFMRKLPYRFLWTATAAPNDYIELGTSSECLGNLGHMDMIGVFFKTVDGSGAAHGGADLRQVHPGKRNNPLGGKFRFRGHAEQSFWQWICSWARACRKPSDLGFDDNAFVLPKLTTAEFMVKARLKSTEYLFDMPAISLSEQRDERRRTLKERCEKAAELVTKHKGSSVSWCALNIEGDLLEKLIPNCVQVSGSNSDEEKEEAFEAFQKGEIKNMVTKADIAGFGLNWQHCNHQTYFPSHSFEQWYQCIRRSWRFGQKKPVHVDIITSEGEARVRASLQRKAKAAGEMFDNLIRLMNNEIKIEQKKFTKKLNKPLWLS